MEEAETIRVKDEEISFTDGDYELDLEMDASEMRIQWRILWREDFFNWVLGRRQSQAKLAEWIDRSDE